MWKLDPNLVKITKKYKEKRQCQNDTTKLAQATFDGMLGIHYVSKIGPMEVRLHTS